MKRPVLPALLVVALAASGVAAATAAVDPPAPATAATTAGETARQASEAAVKAAFVFKFGDYVDWPAGAFADDGAPLVVGVRGAEAVATELERLVAGRTMAGRPVQVRRLAADEGIDGLHVLYAGGDDPGGLPPDTAGLLTITEAAGGMPRGSVVNFVVVDSRVRFDIALRGAERRRLKVSSRLLSVARNVTGRR